MVWRYGGMAERRNSGTAERQNDGTTVAVRLKLREIASTLFSLHRECPEIYLHLQLTNLLSPFFEKFFTAYMHTANSNHEQIIVINSRPFIVFSTFMNHINAVCRM